MNYTDRHIVETYSNLFEGLSSLSKIELIENLSKSLKANNKSKDKKFFKSFGAFASDKPVDVLLADIKQSRKFRSKEIKL